MAYWDRERRGPEEKDLDAPYPSRPFKPDVKLTVLEDEICVATIGLVGSCALVGREHRCRPTHTGKLRRSDIDRPEYDC